MRYLFGWLLIPTALAIWSIDAYGLASLLS